MDLFSVLAGFLAGGLTGAMGNYIADKYTDQRREKKATKEARKIWDRTVRLFPAIIAEMKVDVCNHEFAHVRKFYVKTRGSTIHSSVASFEYHTDVHVNLITAVAHLVDAGYIDDITPGNCPMFRMRLPFIDLLKSLH